MLFKRSETEDKRRVESTCETFAFINLSIINQISQPFRVKKPKKIDKKTTLKF